MAITISGDTPNFSAATITTGTVTTLTSTTGTVTTLTSTTGTVTTLIAPTSTITTLNAPSGVLATQNGMTGIAKAWVQYNASTQTINNSFNVSSVTYNSTGNYTVNFTTAMANTYYAVSGTARSPSVTSGTLQPETYNTTNCVIIALSLAGSGFDPVQLNVIFNGT